MRGRWVHEGTADGGGWNGDGERRSGEMDGSSQPSQLWTGRHGINDTEITPMLTMVDVVLVGVYIYIGAFLLWPLGATKQSHQVGAHSLKSCTKICDLSLNCYQNLTSEISHFSTILLFFLPNACLQVSRILY